MKSPLVPSRFRRFESARRSRWFRQSVGLLALASVPLAARSGKAANTQDTYISPNSTSLTTAANWSLGTVPTSADDAVFGGSLPNTAVTLSTAANNFAFGSLDDVNLNALTITNGTSTTTASKLTLGGGSSTGNSFAPSAADLLYVGTGAALTIANGGTGALNVVLGQSGNLDVAGTSTISSVISDGGLGFGITKTGSGTLTLSGANTFSGGLALNAGTVSIAAVNNLGTGTVSFGGGLLVITAAVDPSAQFSQAASQAYNINNSAAVTFATALTSSGGTLAKAGSSVLTLTGANTFSGSTTVNGGSVALSGAAGSLASTAITLQGGGLALDNTGAGNNNPNRLADTAAITLAGGTFVFTGSDQTGVSSSETVGSFTSSAKSNLTNVITVTPSAGGGTATLTAGSLSRPAGGNAILVNGAGLGSSTASTSQFFLTTAPALVGAGTPAASGDPGAGVQVNTGIVPGLVGESSTTTSTGVGTVTGTANTFLTYTATGGLRPLNPTDEFSSTVAAGANVRIATPTSGVAATTINSLVTSGSATLAGSTLTISSGMVLAGSTGAVSTPLAFGSTEGVFFNTAAETFSGAISGSNGLTKTGGSGLTLSGVITLSGGVLNDAELGETISGSNNLTGASAAVTGGNTMLLGNVNAIAGAASITALNGSEIRLTAGSGSAGAGALTTYATVPVILGDSTNFTNDLDFQSTGGSGNNSNFVVPGQITIASPTIQAIRSFNTFSNAAALTGGITSTAANNGGIEFQSGGSTMTSDHRITLSGTLDYAGPTQLAAISSSNLRVAISGTTLPSGTVLGFRMPVSGTDAQFDLNGNNQTVAGLQTIQAAGTAATQVINSSATASTFTVNNTANDVYSGSLGTVGAINTGGTAPNATGSTATIILAAGTSNGFSLVKSGTGTLTLVGANSFTGSTSITGGTLSIGAITGAAAATIGLNTSSGVSVSGTGALTLNVLGALSDTGTLTMASGTTLNLKSTTGTETIGALVLDGTSEPAGTYTAAQLDGFDNGAVFFNSSGETLTIVPAPEPSTYIGGTLLFGVLAFRFRNRFKLRAA